MRKIKMLAAIAASLFALQTRAQVVPVHVVEIAPEVLCAGDSIEVKFIFTQTISPTQPFSVELSMAHGSTLWVDTIFTGYVGQLVSLDTLSTGEPIYQSKQKVPAFAPPGTWTITGNILADDYAYITVNQCSSYPQLLTYSPPTVCINDSICVTVYDPNRNPFYFNIETQSASGPNVLHWYETRWDTTQGDTMHACYIVPDFLPPGPAQVGLNMVSLFPLTIVDCYASLKEYAAKSPPREAVYFNLLGEKTELRPNELLIWRTDTDWGKFILLQP